MSKKHPLTQEQFDSVVQEIFELENVLIPNNSKSIKIAKEQGDLSENAEYDDAKEQQAKLHQRLLLLKDRKQNAVIIQKSTQTDYVEVGHKVGLQRLSDNQQIEVILIGQWDGTGQSTSIDSPLGVALVGKTKDEEFSVDAPIGEINYKVLSIE